MTAEPAEKPAQPGIFRHPATPYVAPFVAYLLFLALDQYVPLAPVPLLALRFSVVLGLIVFVSRPVLSLRTSHLLGSIVLGVAVFVIWVGPDLLWPAYRQSWLFKNALLGSPKSSLAPELKTNLVFIVFRVLSSVVNVPVLEELFWRGWLMRWLIAKDFQKVRLGTYGAQSFWLVAVLFASEHGSYWDVGLITGIIYNWWMIRTRSLGDCIVAHSVTNACLAGYVLYRDQWQYWL
jgi:CAAX prenyl protease-like protein